MISARPYQAKRSSQAALAELWANAGTQFDPAVVSAFARIVATVTTGAEAAA